MLILMVGYMVALVSCAYVLSHLSLQPPRCPVCRMTTEPLPARDVASIFLAFEVTHWCTRCARVVSRRVVQVIGE